MSSRSNNHGRAFEYICIHVLYERISCHRLVEIKVDSSFNANERAWRTLSYEEQSIFRLSAKSIIDTLFALEPRAITPSVDPLLLSFQPDNKGTRGGVRDIIIERKDINWVIGLSLKTNHDAAKHSRLAENLDFGANWYGVPCSSNYWSAVNPIFTYLGELKKDKILFRDIKDKARMIYLPILSAFLDEVKSQVLTHPDIPARLIKYILGTEDYYKVISMTKKELTRIQPFNINGTLNQAAEKVVPSIRINKLELPNSLLYGEIKSNSYSTGILCFDNGWQLTFRLHNAEDIATPSLKFDIRIVGMPCDLLMIFECKWKK